VKFDDFYHYNVPTLVKFHKLFDLIKVNNEGKTMNSPQRRTTGLQIHPDFANFVNNEVLPLTSLDKDKFWDDFAKLIDDFSPVNKELLEARNRLQEKIDQWHITHRGQSFDKGNYKQFLQDIGYLLPEGEDFSIETENVDEEITSIAGPQLVVPLKNARFALNAANARWGSLYDAAYGTDVITESPGLTITPKYNTERGKKVIEYTKEFLDETFPLQEGSHKHVSAYMIYFNNLLATFPDGNTTGLQDNSQFVASNGSKSNPESIVLKNNGLHIELQFDRNGVIGSQDLAGIEDIQVESAMTTVMDCEDLVAAVDAEDKITVYRNWLGLMEGNLKTSFEKRGKTIERRLRYDRRFTSRDGEPYILHGRSLLMIRNVGLHMDTELVRDHEGKELPEGIIDAVITALVGSLDLNSDRSIKNSREGSIYIVKPKLHGPEEVEFTCDLFGRIEEILNLDHNTIKMGIMDEERRTSLNLKESIRAGKQRIVFINTGVLDRVGDEIHTSMQAGAVLPKASIYDQDCITAYEQNNVAVGLACGFQGRAQIGKGMWAMPDEMNRMMEENISHPQDGADASWVPSPTAATLHALHYHKIDVTAVQEDLKKQASNNIDGMLNIPLINDNLNLTVEDVESELENNIQAILSYMAPWIEQGNGCSKVYDLNNIGLMEDRATLRISSQHIANWLLHRVCQQSQVENIMERMAFIVDKQNEGTPDYKPMTPNLYESTAFKAARALIINGVTEANGYIESTLQWYRREAKSLNARAEENFIQSQTKEAS
jgi:malate synthase